MTQKTPDKQEFFMSHNLANLYNLSQAKSKKPFISGKKDYKSKHIDEKKSSKSLQSLQKTNLMFILIP